MPKPIEIAILFDQIEARKQRVERSKRFETLNAKMAAAMNDPGVNMQGF